MTLRETVRSHTRGLPAIASAKTGEIATTLTLVSLVVMVAGLLTGGKAVEQVQKYTGLAAGSCHYLAVNELRDADTNQVLSNVGGLAWRNSFGDTASFPSAGVIRSRWDTDLEVWKNAHPSFAPVYDKIMSDGYAQTWVELSSYPSSEYDVVGIFTESCRGQTCSSVRAARSTGGTANGRIDRIRIECGGGLTYGWKLRKKVTPTATPIPSPTRAVTPTKTPPKPTPTTHQPQRRTDSEPTSTPVPSPTRVPTATPRPTAAPQMCGAHCDVGSGPSLFGFDLLRNGCARGYTCVDVCRDGSTACPHYRKGVCRASACPTDATCTCRAGTPQISPVVLPTRSPLTIPTATPTSVRQINNTPTPTPRTPAVAPCFFRSRLVVKDEAGAPLPPGVRLRPELWHTVNSAAVGVKGEFTHYGERAPLLWEKWPFPPRMEEGGLAQSIFLHTLPPTGRGLTDITLVTDPAWEVVQRKINRHCQYDFDGANRLVIGCSDVETPGQSIGVGAGVVVGGDPATLPQLSVACNMDIDAEWVVRKKPVRTGALEVKVQLSAGDMSNNIPFMTNRIRDMLPSSRKDRVPELKKEDNNPYEDRRSSVKITGVNEYGEPFVQSHLITQATQLITGIPVGTHSISYTFPVGVLSTITNEGNRTQVYRLNTPPIDGDKVQIQTENTYTYRVLYNMNTGACRAVRNPDSCRSCKGEPIDWMLRDSRWKNNDGDTMCCPTSREARGGRPHINPGDFECKHNFDNRCTPGDIWYGNCGHKFGAGDHEFCSQGERARYVCHGERWWEYKGCVDSPSTMDRCIQPTPTPIPRPTRVPGRGGAPTVAPQPTCPPGRQCSPGHIPPESASIFINTVSTDPAVEKIEIFFNHAPYDGGLASHVIISPIKDKLYTLEQSDLDRDTEYPVWILAYDGEGRGIEDRSLFCNSLRAPAKADYPVCFLQPPGTVHVRFGSEPSRTDLTSITARVRPVFADFKPLTRLIVNSWWRKNRWDYGSKVQKVVEAPNSGETYTFEFDNMSRSEIYMIEAFGIHGEDSAAASTIRCDGTAVKANQCELMAPGEVEFELIETGRVNHCRTSKTGTNGDFTVVFMSNKYRNMDEFVADSETMIDNFYKNNLKSSDQKKFTFKILENLDIDVTSRDDVLRALSACGGSYGVIIEDVGSYHGNCGHDAIRISNVAAKTSDHILSHELGHCIANLSDEYIVEGWSEPWGGEASPNCDRDPTCSKWNSYHAGCFAGCTTSGWYRPNEWSIMTGSWSSETFNKPSLRKWSQTLNRYNSGPITPRLLTHEAIESYHNALKIDLQKTAGKTFEVKSIESIQTYPLQYKTEYELDYYKIAILDSGRKELFTGKFRKFISESVEEIYEDDEPILYVPHFKNAKSVMIDDENGKTLLDIDIDSYNLPAPIANQNLCGNNICDAPIGENANSCPQDCRALDSAGTTSDFVKASDINDDGVVNSLDYALFSQGYRASTLATLVESDTDLISLADINGDGKVNALDSSIIIDNFGKEVQ